MLSETYNPKIIKIWRFSSKIRSQEIGFKIRRSPVLFMYMGTQSKKKNLEKISIARKSNLKIRKDCGFLYSWRTLCAC